ncbi:MAG: polysaccharide deacetylase family protein [Chitinophagaceae bacterium]
MRGKKLLLDSGFIIFVLCILLVLCKREACGQTEITQWQYDKKGAISVTYDDGNRNQFKIALPIMEKLKLPATFFIITGPIKGSRYQGKFIGRPVKDIIEESAKIPTDGNNFFERASASRYLGYAGASRTIDQYTGVSKYYNLADAFYESGKKDSAYYAMNELFKLVRAKKLKPGTYTSMEIDQERGLNWQKIKGYAAKGYEFASHTVTHAHLAILDTANMLYELEKSKQDLLDHLGAKYTFSAEVPFGIDDPRVMKYSMPVYQALRNQMTDPYLEEINRGYKADPGISDKPYVQWQRGPISSTQLWLMKSWVDTVLAHHNIWLVLVIHGVDNLGWEPLTHEMLQNYFVFIKKNENDLWVAPFGDVARYMRERMHAKVLEQKEQDRIIITLTHSLNKAYYHFPLTLKTYVPSDWKSVRITQQNQSQNKNVERDKKGSFILFQANPNQGNILLSKLRT